MSSWQRGRRSLAAHREVGRPLWLRKRRFLGGQLALKSADASLQAIEDGDRSFELGHPAPEGLVIRLQLPLPALVMSLLSGSNNRPNRT